MARRTGAGGTAATDRTARRAEAGSAAMMARTAALRLRAAGDIKGVPRTLVFIFIVFIILIRRGI
jgi:hypothetical protein